MSFNERCGGIRGTFKRGISQVQHSLKGGRSFRRTIRIFLDGLDFVLRFEQQTSCDVLFILTPSNSGEDVGFPHRVDFCIFR